MSIPVINLEYTGMPADVYCPACGKAIYAGDESPRCEHAVFTFIPEIGDFDYAAPHTEEQVAAIMAKAEDDDDKLARGSLRPKQSSNLDKNFFNLRPIASIAISPRYLARWLSTFRVIRATGESSL